MRPQGPAAVLVTVGDELLLGETLDGNGAWLGRELARTGLRVLRRYTVGDDAEDIQEVTRRGLAEARVVILTGGLGPTADDLTRPAVAELLGAPLRLDEGILEALRQRFLRRGFDELPETNVSQAMVPEGATVLPNPHGTAPGLVVETEEGLVALLPGVPREMEAIFRGALEPLLRKRLGPDLRPVHQRMIHMTGISESDLAGQVERALSGEEGTVRVAFLPHVTGVDLRLTVRDIRDPAEAARHLDRVEEKLAPVVDGFRYEEGDLADAVSRRLEALGLTLGTAESCTGGLVAKRLTDRPGASRVFAGGVVAYADATKVALLGVERESLRREGAVSEGVARAMAVGVASALGCACGLAITGVAGPGGGTEEKPVGLVWYAASVEGHVVAERRMFPGDRIDIRERAGQAALALLYRLLRDRE